jgi:manganese/iron transport system substrate-binding protein
MNISSDRVEPYFKHLQAQMTTILLLCGLVSGCNSPSRQQSVTANPDAIPTHSTATSNKPQVLVTNSVLCDLTSQIAASTIDLVCLLTPGSDPHLYKITPQARKSIDRAKLLMYGGYNLEPELIRAIEATSNSAPKVAVYEAAVPQPQQFEEDGQSTTDPHVWHNAKNGVKIAAVIQANLEKLIPAQTATYRKNTQKLTLEITQIDTWIKSQINTIPRDRKILVTTHDALDYYAKAYGISLATLQGVSTEEKPNAARVKELVEKIKTTKAPTIFAELSVDSRLIKTVASEATVQISNQEIYADGLGEANSSGGTYQKMLVSNTRSIVTGLGGKYTDFVSN